MRDRAGSTLREERPRAARRPTPSIGFAPPRTVATAAAALALMLAFVLGGSQQHPLGSMIVELGAVIAIVAMIASFDAAHRRDARPALIAALVVLTVAAIELVPLPYALWTGLPGHDLAAGARAVAGLAPVSLPLSLDPHATIGALLAVLPGLALFAAGLAADRATLRLLTGIVVLGALASAMLGALQLGGGPDFYLFADTHLGYAVGLFANRNHEADLLLVAILLTAALARGQGGGTDRRALLFGVGVAALLTVAVVVTGSRTGLLLLPPVLLAAVTLALLRSRRGLIAVIGAAVVVLAGLAALSAFSPVMGRVLARYQTAGEDLRFEFWRNSWFAIHQYWPTGSGLGSFVPVYQTIEPLDTMPPTIANHAHDDYLELLLELGAGAVVLIVGYVTALGWAVIRGARRPGVVQAAATIAIMVLLAHSLVDYPLRTPALMAVFGLLNAMVFRRPDPVATTRPAKPGSHRSGGPASAG